MPRKEPAAPPPPPALQRKPRTALQLARQNAMDSAAPYAITQRMIFDELKRRGVRLSKSTVGHVLSDRYRNDDVIRVFCELTGTDAATMFPPKREDERSESADQDDSADDSSSAAA